MKQKITSAVSEVFGFDGNNIFQKTRKQEIVLARQMCFYYLRKELGWTHSKIACLFSLNHATIIHGVTSFEFKLGVYEEEKYLFTRLKAELGFTPVGEKELLSSFINYNQKHLSIKLINYLKSAL